MHAQYGFSRDKHVITPRECNIRYTRTSPSGLQPSGSVRVYQISNPRGCNNLYIYDIHISYSIYPYVVLCPWALIDYCPRVYSIQHSEPWFKWFESCFVGVMFVQHLVAWKQGCWRPSIVQAQKRVAYFFRWRGKADLQSHCRRKRWIVSVKALLLTCSRQHHHWAVRVSSCMTGVTEEQIVHLFYSKIQLPKAYHCCVIYGIRTKPSQVLS